MSSTSWWTRCSRTSAHANSKRVRDDLRRRLKAGAASEMSSVGEVLRRTSSELGSLGEARWIVSHAAGRLASTDGEILTRLADDAPVGLEAKVTEMVRRRQSGEPLQYILGSWQFRELEVRIDQRVLIPRPETEEVVTYALNRLCAVGSGRVVAADLGTGSGVIALSLATEASCGSSCSLEIWGTDASEDALDVARENLDLAARGHPHVKSIVRFARGYWFEALPDELAGHLDLVVSNPPYVSATEWQSLTSLVRDYEPYDALVSGDTGLEAFETIVHDAWSWIARRGSLVLELAPHQADAVTQMTTSTGFEEVEVHPDMAGLPRVLTAVKA